MAESNDQGFFQNKSRMMGIGLIMVLISIFLLNWGLRDGDWAYWVGLVLLFGGLILAPLSRFTAGESEDENGDGDTGADEAKEQGE